MSNNPYMSSVKSDSIIASFTKQWVAKRKEVLAWISAGDTLNIGHQWLIVIILTTKVFGDRWQIDESTCIWSLQTSCGYIQQKNKSSLSESSNTTASLYHHNEENDTNIFKVITLKPTKMDNMTMKLFCAESTIYKTSPPTTLSWIIYNTLFHISAVIKRKSIWQYAKMRLSSLIYSQRKDQCSLESCCGLDTLFCVIPQQTLLIFDWSIWFLIGFEMQVSIGAILFSPLENFTLNWPKKSLAAFLLSLKWQQQFVWYKYNFIVKMN